MKEFGVQNFMGAHCTGVNAVYEIRQRMGLPRKQAVVGAVGASYDLEKGIDPRDVAK